MKNSNYTTGKEPWTVRIVTQVFERYFKVIDSLVA